MKTLSVSNRDGEGVQSVRKASLFHQGVAILSQLIDLDFTSS